MCWLGESLPLWSGGVTVNSQSPKKLRPVNSTLHSSSFGELLVVIALPVYSDSSVCQEKKQNVLCLARRSDQHKGIGAWIGYGSNIIRTSKLGLIFKMGNGIFFGEWLNWEASGKGCLVGIGGFQALPGSCSLMAAVCASYGFCR